MSTGVTRRYGLCFPTFSFLILASIRCFFFFLSFFFLSNFVVSLLSYSSSFTSFYSSFQFLRHQFHDHSQLSIYKTLPHSPPFIIPTLTQVPFPTTYSCPSLNSSSPPQPPSLIVFYRIPFSPSAPSLLITIISIELPMTSSLTPLFLSLPFPLTLATIHKSSLLHLPHHTIISTVTNVLFSSLPSLPFPPLTLSPPCHM